MVCRRRRVGIAVGVLVAALVLGACQTARVGTRCKAAGAWGQDATSILRCQNRRWVRVMSKADYARLLVTVQQQRAAEAEAARAAAAAANPPPPPPAPARPVDVCAPVVGGDGYHVVYAVPADVAVDPAIPSAIQHELGLVASWYRRETNGVAPRFLRDATGLIRVCVMRLASTRTELDQAGDGKYWVIREQIEARTQIGDDAAIAFTSYDNAAICGTANTGFAVIYFGVCGSPNLAAPSPFRFDDTLITTAHEIVHTMGAAQPCAPNYDIAHPGHVDDPLDVLYYGQFADDYLTDLRLDPGRDDYYGHGRPGCWDIAAAPWWE